jgi:protoporphyrinogen/coproporphyrinogen III oxidase
MSVERPAAGTSAVDVVIVGGGIAGLATAYELHRRAVSFTLLEARTRAGGVVLSEHVDGFVIDAGPDALLVQKPDGIKLCQELGIGDRLVPTKPPRVAYIQRAGRLHPLPEASVLGIPTRWGPFLRSGLFSWSCKLRMAAELFIPPARPSSPSRPFGPDSEDAADESIGAFMRRRFGVEATEYLAEPLLAGIHAGDVDRLSIRTLFPRFVEAERQHGSLLRAFRKPPPTRPGAGGAPSTSDGAFRSLPGGLSELIEALLLVLPAEAIRLGRRVRRLESTDGRFVVVPETEHPTIEARVVVLATPAFATASIVRNLDPQLATCCDAIPYASAATVSLAFDASAVTRPLVGSGFVVPRREAAGILAGSWLSSKWPHRAPEGRVLMRTFIGGARDPLALELSDAEMVRRSLTALTPLVGITAPPLFTRVYRWERSNAQHEVGHEQRLAAIDRALIAHPGLFLTGSAYRGVGIPDCVSDGRATAARVAAWLDGAPQ